MDKIIIGLVGPIASGKGVIANYLKSNDFGYQSLSDVVREEAVKRGLTPSRENLQNIGNELRTTFGGQILAERALKKLIKNTGNIVIDSIRNPEEISFLKKNFDIYIIGIDAPISLRESWYLGRAKERGEDIATSADFVTANGRDSGIGETSMGQQVNACLLRSDIIIENWGSKNDLIESLKEVILEKYNTTIEGGKKSIERK